MRLLRSVFLAALFLAACQGGATPAAAPQAHAITIVNRQSFASAPFTLIDNRIFVRAHINGGGPYAMIFDTGGANIVTPEVAEALGLSLRDQFSMPGAGEREQPAWRARVDEARLGDIRMTDLDFTVLSLSPIQQAIGFERLDGLFGHELLRRYIVRIDYASGTLQFAERSAAPEAWFRGAAIPFTFVGNLPSVAIKIDGVEARVALDTGDRSSLTLFGPFVADHGLRERQQRLRTVSGWGVGGPILADMARSERLELGPFALSGVVTRMPVVQSGVFASRIADGSIGNEVLRRFDITFDYERQLFYLSPNARFSDRDRFERSGLWARLPETGAGFEIFAVAPESPASRAGLSAGERIVAIDNAPATSQTLIDWRTRLSMPNTQQWALRVETPSGSARDLTLVIPAE
jgi:hypothetical protein